VAGTPSRDWDPKNIGQALGWGWVFTHGLHSSWAASEQGHGPGNKAGKRERRKEGGTPEGKGKGRGALSTRERAKCMREQAKCMREHKA
jgi:hypothetical protein